MLAAHGNHDVSLTWERILPDDRTHSGFSRFRMRHTAASTMFVLCLVAGACAPSPLPHYVDLSQVPSDVRKADIVHLRTLDVLCELSSEEERGARRLVQQEHLRFYDNIANDAEWYLLRIDGIDYYIYHNSVYPKSGSRSWRYTLPESTFGTPCESDMFGSEESIERIRATLRQFDRDR